MSKPIKTEFFVNDFGVEMRKDTYLDAYGKEVTIAMPVGEPEPVEPEPTQLDRIEAEIMKSNDELRQEGAETIVTELIDRGIL